MWRKTVLWCIVCLIIISFLQRLCEWVDVEVSRTITTTSSVEKKQWKVVTCETSKGSFRVDLLPELAPNGTKFFVGLVNAGYFNQTIPFFRVNSHITQFGITKRFPRDQDPFLHWREGAERDENPFGGLGKDEQSVQKRKKHPWKRGTFASIGGFHFLVVIQANKHMGINRHDAALGEISEEDMVNVFDRLFAYNDIINNPKGGKGPHQGSILQHGMDYIREEFPLTDVIKGCKAHML